MQAQRDKRVKKMYVGKTVDRHKGKFDWALIAAALSSIVCAGA